MKLTLGLLTLGSFLLGAVVFAIFFSQFSASLSEKGRHRARRPLRSLLMLILYDHRPSGPRASAHHLGAPASEEAGRCGERVPLKTTTSS